MKFLKLLIGLAVATGVASAAQLTPGLPLIAIGPTNITTTNAAGFRAAIGAAASASVPPPAVLGKTIHVEEHGDDGTGTGTVDFPYRTLTAALAAKTVGDIILIGPGTFTLTQATAHDTVDNALWLTNYLTIEGAGPNTTISFVPYSDAAVNWALGAPYQTALTGVTLRNFTLDLNAGVETWGSGAKVDGIGLYGTGHLIENVWIVDQGGNANAESFGVFAETGSGVVIRNVRITSPDSANCTGIAIGDMQHATITGCYVDGLNKGVAPHYNISNSRITENTFTNVTGYGIFYDTAGTVLNWNTTISRNKLWKGTGGQVAIELRTGAWADMELRDNQMFFWPGGIVLTNSNASATNYFERTYVDRNHIVGTGAAVIGFRASGGITNASIYRNVVWNGATNYYAGTGNHGNGNVNQVGNALSDLPNALVGSGTAITALNDDAVDFDDADSNWTATTIGAALEELDDANGGGAPNQATGKVNWEQLVNVPAGFADNTDDGGAGDSNWVADGTTNSTLPGILYAHGGVFTNDVTINGSLILAGNGPSLFDSVTATNAVTNVFLTATRVPYTTTAGKLTDDADLTFGTDTLYATKLTSTDVRAGLGVFTNTVTLPQSDDPDVSAPGHISWDTDGWLRAYDGANQVAVGRKIEEIHATIAAPNDLADAVRDACLIWSNESGMNFVITGWKGWSGTDDTTLNIEETDADGANNATVDAVEIATNGTGVFYGSDTTITAATIENGHLLWLDFDDTDTPTYVKITIYGYYDADVN